MSSFNFFATCPKGIEEILAQELESLGAEKTRLTVAGVYFTGSLATAYKTCLWSRLANRILLKLSTVSVISVKDLYDAVYTIDWRQHVSPTGTLIVDFVGESAAIKNTQFGAQKVKDAIVDQLRAHTGQRPSVEKHQPHIRVHAHLHKEKLTLSLDLAGASLHQRGYRTVGGAAPLKENLAAAILYRAKWPELKQQCNLFVDPLCGSGTFLIEAAMMATDTAPGLSRDYFGFTRWLGHQPTIWKQLLDEARERHQLGMQAKIPPIYGYDASERSIEIAAENIANAGLTEKIQLTVKRLDQIQWPESSSFGLLVTNPPYGERMGDVQQLQKLYAQLGQQLKEHCVGWEAAVFTGNPDLGKHMGLRSRKQYALFNGALPCKLLLFTVAMEWFVNKPPPVL